MVVVIAVVVVVVATEILPVVRINIWYQCLSDHNNGMIMVLW